MSTWYYVDARHDRQGPVSDEELALAFRQGRVNRDTLVWREGLSLWVPLEGHLASLPQPPPVLPPAGATTGPANPAAVTPAGAVSAQDFEGVVDAGFIRRLAAYLIDAMLIGSAFYVVLLVGVLGLAVVGAGQDMGQDAFAIGFAGLYLLYPAMSLAYFAGMECSSLQATVGKLALGIKVVDGQGRRLGFGRAAGRWAGSIVSYLILYIGFFMAGWTRRKQALHDLMAGTFVVDKWAYTDQPGRQVRELHGCLVAVVAAVVVMSVLAVAGILAAVSVPAYQDYVVRSRLVAAYAEGSAAYLQVAQFQAQTDRCPRDGAELGLAAPTSADIQEILVIENPDGTCEIAVTLRDLDALKGAAGGVLYIGQDPDGVRTCSAEGVPDGLLPGACH
ncbi:RDD family protein [Arenimonas sp.]|uniref:RDD family protein n=1 Tax=Arenimonas sp. TaxID=1872635 RepID=UPI0035B19235